MKKSIFIMVCLMLISQMSLNAKSKLIPDKFLNSLIKSSKSKVDNVGKELVKKAPKSNNIVKSKLDDLPASIKKDDTKSLIFAKADEIVKKGDFEKGFFSSKNFDDQLLIIQQSNKYGDEYFSIAKKLDANNVNLLKQNQFISQKLLSGKYINLTNQQLENKYIKVLEYTGNKGWQTLKKISELAVKNPGKSIIAASFLWYVVDPESFEEALQASGQELGAFLLTIASATGSGITEGVKNEIKQSIESGKYTMDIVFGVIFIVLFIILLRKRKKIWHFLTKAEEVTPTPTENIKKQKGNIQDEF